MAVLTQIPYTCKWDCACANIVSSWLREFKWLYKGLCGNL